MRKEAQAAAAAERSDAELIASVRAGRTAAYGTLYARHVYAARRQARALVSSRSAGDDLVSEAFERVLTALRSRNGPTESFRAYLLTTVRNLAFSQAAAERRLELSDDLENLVAFLPAAQPVDPALVLAERALVIRAFTQLPERWQAVLWHTEVEGESAADVAPLLGLAPNAVSALAYRAREGLRQAYLQAHVADVACDAPCRTIADKLGARVSGKLAARHQPAVTAHLKSCARCQACVAELSDVHDALRSALGLDVIGVAAVAYVEATASVSAVAWLGHRLIRHVLVGSAIASAVAATVGAALALSAAGTPVPPTHPLPLPSWSGR